MESTEPAAPRIEDTFKDYWNEWAGLLMWLPPVSQDEARVTFEAKALISGGSLVRSFDERCAQATPLLSALSALDRSRVEGLNELAAEANSLWQENLLSPESILRLADRAHLLIYGHSYAERRTVLF